MKVTTTPLHGLQVLEPKVFGDERGFFYESFNQRRFTELTGITAAFVQDNHSKSARHVLRGLHYQIQQAQGKLVRAVAGAVLDVVLDIRRSSPTFGQSYALELSFENKKMLWIPPGFAHGFVVLSESAEFLYKTTDYYAPEFERAILWNDPVLAIDWQLNGAEPVLSGKDKAGKLLKDAEVLA
jgi:dTDP-4-dehydrorhamnose 3,5-epimerase